MSGDDELVERYHARLHEWQAEIGQFVTRRGGSYVAVPSDLDLARPPVRCPPPAAGRRMSGLLAPFALAGLVALPVIVAFYMLRLRRRDVPVGSTFLWQQLVRDIEANAPWQRLRFSWLLLLQLLIAALVVIAAARPFATVHSELAANVVLVIDTSASMGATDAAGPRIEAARAAARTVIGRLPEGGRVTVVAADDSAHVLASETRDRSTALAAIAGVQSTAAAGRPDRCVRARLRPSRPRRRLDRRRGDRCDRGPAAPDRHRCAGRGRARRGCGHEPGGGGAQRGAAVGWRPARHVRRRHEPRGGGCDAAARDLRRRRRWSTRATSPSVRRSARRRSSAPFRRPRRWSRRASPAATRSPSTIARWRSCPPAHRSGRSS